MLRLVVIPASRQEHDVDITQTIKAAENAACRGLVLYQVVVNREGKDTESPERQRANIVRVCEQHGGTPEFYEDTDGHRSGATEKNGPGWLALKARLGDSDIAALVATDLSRLYRKGWLVGDLLDFVDEHDFKLLLAAQGKLIDFSTPLGRIMIQMSVIFDEMVCARYRTAITR